MEPFECYTFEEAIDHETSFAISHYQVYIKITENLWSKVNLLSNFGLEAKRDQRQTSQITEPPQAGKLH